MGFTVAATEGLRCLNEKTRVCLLKHLAHSNHLNVSNLIYYSFIQFIQRVCMRTMCQALL